MTPLDRPLYREGTEISAAITRGRQRRAAVSCRYLGPVGKGGLHYVADAKSGTTYRVPIENIRRQI